ncbi:DoxX family protein [Chitinophaga nivalis]|uniref:DoxX family protein n=1 Tax=Chitinophaga nivalis TaxID=2991709 RepID=A0ABT3IR84_9BACT|nr:hypothetical protein [Chitinophaga nivalis]MCW3463847.1 hypothetical protein [Chitinophaga nivalis]MCW3486463.1 hypothetical protein [Chitinophaga nivalis]
MAFLSGLLSIALLLWGAGHLFHIPLLQQLPDDARIAAAVMFLLIGTFHLVKPKKLTYMIRGMLPFPLALVIGTGILEIVLGAGLLFSGTQYRAGIALVILLVAMFPANIRVAVNQLPPPGGLPAKPWYTWSRLLFQPVYILWILWAIHAI